MTKTQQMRSYVFGLLAGYDDLPRGLPQPRPTLEQLEARFGARAVAAAVRGGHLKSLSDGTVYVNGGTVG